MGRMLSHDGMPPLSERNEGAIALIRPRVVKTECHSLSALAGFWGSTLAPGFHVSGGVEKLPGYLGLCGFRSPAKISVTAWPRQRVSDRAQPIAGFGRSTGGAAWLRRRGRQPASWSWGHAGRSLGVELRAGRGLAGAAPGPLVVVWPHVDDVDDFCDDLALFSDVRPNGFRPGNRRREKSRSTKSTATVCGC